jgi:hypothetical protein
MGKVLIKIGKVVEVEDKYSIDGADALRIRAKLNEDKTKTDNRIPWAWPLLPKTLQSVPKVGESVLIIADAVDEFSEGQRYYIGPLISQPQYMTLCPAEYSTSLLKASETLPLERMSDEPTTKGSFPKAEDVALIGRGREDVILKYNKDSQCSEVDIRAGIRKQPTSLVNPGIIGNIIFNDTDPAYIQLKYSKGLARRQKYSCSSAVNIVADYINIISNHDANVNDNIHDSNDLVKDANFDDTINSLHQVPKGDKLVELLTIIKGAIMHHVHPWAGMEQCGDWAGFIKKLEGYDIESILSDFVRIS